MLRASLLSLSTAVALLLGATASAASLGDFVQGVKANDKLTAEQRDAALKLVDQMQADDEAPADIAYEVLMQIYPSFSSAMSSLGEEEVDAAITELDKLAAEQDPYLVAESTYFLGRAHMMAERYEESITAWKALLDKHAKHTFRTAEGLFFQGMCQSQLLQRKEAIASLDKFIVEYEDAPERMQVAAWHELELLKATQDGTLGDVQDRMEFSRRRLAIEETGKRTQEKQDNIIALLEKLIKESEEKECQGGGGGGGGQGGQQGGSQQGGQGGSNGQSGSGGGGAASGNPNHPLDKAGSGSRSASRTPWGKVRDADREAKAFAALKAKFPGRYKELIEQYYRSLNEEEGLE